MFMCVCVCVSQMKKNSPETQKKFEAAAAFRLFDPKLQGRMTRQDFSKLHSHLVRAKLTSLGLDECIGLLDAGLSGLVHFNDCMQLVEHPPPAARGGGGAAGHVVHKKGDSDEKAGAKKGGCYCYCFCCNCLFINHILSCGCCRHDEQVLRRVQQQEGCARGGG